MIQPSIDKLLTKVGSKYLLVNVVARRSKEMETTEFYQMKEKEYSSKKNIGRALEEISKNLIQNNQYFSLNNTNVIFFRTSFFFH